MNLKFLENLSVELETTNNGESTFIVLEAEKDYPQAQVLSSSQAGKLKSKSKILEWPGEYEIQGVMFKGTEAEDQLTIFSTRIEEMMVVHLGKTKDISTDIVKQLGDIDVLILPVHTDIRTAKAAKELSERIEARYIIPLGDMASDFIEMSGLHKSEIEGMAGKIKISKSGLPQDKTEVINLSS